MKDPKCYFCKQDPFTEEKVGYSWVPVCGDCSHETGHSHVEGNISFSNIVTNRRAERKQFFNNKNKSYE